MMTSSKPFPSNKNSLSTSFTGRLTKVSWGRSSTIFSKRKQRISCLPEKLLSVVCSKAVASLMRTDSPRKACLWWRRVNRKIRFSMWDLKSISESIGTNLALLNRWWKVKRRQVFWKRQTVPLRRYSCLSCKNAWKKFGKGNFLWKINRRRRNN